VPNHLPRVVNVLLVMEPNATQTERVQAVAPDILRVTAVSGTAFACDGGSVWPAARARSTPLEASGPGASRNDRDTLLREAHVILLALPYPTQLYARTRNLRWVHHPAAGVSNLRNSDLWGAPVPVTTSRGANAALPIAEMAIAGAFIFAKGLHAALRGSLERRDFASNVSLAGKTMGIVGLGGIGSQIARLSRGIGMRVIATRRSAAQRQSDVDGVDELFPPRELHAMLAQSDYVAVCAMLTRETERLLDEKAFAAMKEGSVVINIARGEIIDETAMIAALRCGKVRGAYLDTHAGETNGTETNGLPNPELRGLPNVVITPHISARSDNRGNVGFDLFLENLRRFLAGEPLKNLVDWQRGY